MNRSTTTRAGITVAMLAAAALIPALANATTNSTAGQSSSETVKFGDLDLSRRADTKVLIHRIRVAAHDVCSVNGYAPAQQLCYQKAVSDALKQISQRQPSVAIRLTGPSAL